MAMQSDTKPSDPLSIAVDEALTGETRTGSLLGIAGCLLFFAFQILNSLIDLVTKHQYPAFFRFPAGLLLANIAGPLLSVPLYLIAMRSKRPLFWCAVCIVLDTLWVSELKFFWLVAPPGIEKIPLYLEVRYEDIGAFLMFLAIYSLPLSRRLTLWSSGLMAAVWAAGIDYTYSHYAGASLYVGPFGPGIGDSGLRTFMNPEVLPADFFVIQLVLLGAFAGFLVLAIDRGRQFVVRRVHAAADTALLERFFPPALAARIAAGDANDLNPARRNVAILFANMPAANDLARLRSDYLLFEETVFAHDGVVDRFSGGPAMATFGALGSEDVAAAKAVACARPEDGVWNTGTPFIARVACGGRSLWKCRRGGKSHIQHRRRCGQHGAPHARHRERGRHRRVRYSLCPVVGPRFNAFACCRFGREQAARPRDSGSFVENYSMNSSVSSSWGNRADSIPDDLPAVLGRTGVALFSALYSLARFGVADGGRVCVVAVVFIALDVARLTRLRRIRYGDALEAAAIFLQVGVIGILFLAPAPFGVASDVPPQLLLLQTPTLVLLLCFIASSATVARPSLVWCAGAGVVGLWTVGWRVILADPHTLTQATIHIERYKTGLALLGAVNQPEYFNFNLLKGAFTAALLITLVLGFAIYRIRRLARATSDRETARRALAAYFSPQIVDTILASQRNELSPQEKQVAVLDCDLVGFTSLAETMTPEQVAGTLQSYRSIAETAVFALDGAILSHTGDGVVAAFGLTDSNRDAAERALICARRIASDWTKSSRDSLGEKVVPVAIGVDFGPAQMGLVGKGRSMSLLLLGDAADAAAALQWATREARVNILVGEKARESMVEGNADLVGSLEPCPGIDAWRLHAA